MPIEAVPFTGMMNMDDPDEVMPIVHHRDARNVVFKGTQPNLRIENLPGTVEIENPLLPTEGVNKTIGRFYDPVGKRIFFFNYSENKSGIYVFYKLTKTFDRLLEEGINVVNPLGFTPEVISEIDIIYGDSTQGDILYWIDSLGRPSKINIKRALEGGYGLVRRSYLDVAKEPSSLPPLVVYENDSSVTVNALRKKLFKFKIRWVFDDNDKSVTSSQSEVPLPFDPFDSTVDSDPTKNCRIAIVYQTGAPNVKKIEILASESRGALFSDFYLIASLDKQSEGLPDNDVATYLFYNDKAYNNINVQESIQLFDYVPQSAGAQVVLNGNVLDYGNIKEGYPNLLDFTNGQGNDSGLSVGVAPYYYGQFYSLFAAFQFGETFSQDGIVHVVVRGTVFGVGFTSDTYYVYFKDGTNINYTVSLNDDAAAVIEGLRQDAISKGFIINGVGSNDLYISKAAISLAGYKLDSTFSYNGLLDGSQFVYDWWSKYGYGLVYFDEKGRTNGAVYTDGFSVNSLPYSQSLSPSGDIPKFSASIYHIPPSWASYYQWVRTKDLSKSKILQWVSDRTLKDTNTGLGEDAYAYISIENLNTFIQKNPGTPLGYTFSPNDRIRFIARLSGDGSMSNLYSQNDYEIVASVVNPTVNGIDFTGQFIKIKLPSTNGSFDFGAGFSNYFIELYSPAQPVSNGLELYYEFGERYAIVGGVHQGQLQNQSSDYLTPATFEFTKGDYFIRLRTIQTGQEIVYNITPGFGPDPDAGRITLGLTPTALSYSDPNITPGDSPFNNLIGFNLGSDTNRSILTIGTGTYTFRIRGTIIIIFRDIGPDSYPYEFFLQKNNGTKYQLVAPFDAHNPGTYTFQVDTTFTMNSGERLFIFGWAVNGNDNTRSFAASTLTITREAQFSLRCIDPNFSDYYASAVNSNGRAFLYDPDANQVTYPTMHRWSLAYQEDTNINQTCRFYSGNFDVVDRAWGAIKKMRVWDRILTFFQERKCGQTGVFAKFIQDNEGTNQLVTTNQIITQNNVQYYAGNFGVYNQPDSIVQSQYVYYFVDPILGKVLRLSRDGITDLTEIYKMQTWGAEFMPRYLSNYDYEFGGTARVTGTFNTRKDNTGEYLIVCQSGEDGDKSISGETMAFDENRNCFTSPYDFAPECIICAENVLYSFRNGKLYSHTDNITHNNFYGEPYESYITKVYNANITQKKTFISITEVANFIWDCPEISTSMPSSMPGYKQESNLITQDFVELEGQFSASFLADMNSIGGIVDGDVLKGEYIKIKIRIPKERSFFFSTLTAVLLKYIDSPLNLR
jgi:hypothetical protein